MKKISKKIVLPTLAVILVLAISYAIFGEVMARQNVFAEMLYSQTNKTRFGPEFRSYFRTSYTIIMEGGEYLDENERIFVSVGRNLISSDKMGISFRKHLERDKDMKTLCYYDVGFEYDAFTKTLVYEPIVVHYDGIDSFGNFSTAKDDILYVMEKYNLTKKDIEEFKEYALYQVLLPYWFEKNPETSRFSMDNLGNFTVVDNTFSIFDE